MFDSDDFLDDENLLKPYEIFRHPEARNTSSFIFSTLQKNFYCIIYGKSGIGKSLFVKSHCDIYWNKYKSKYVYIDDPEFVSSDFFDKYDIHLLQNFLYIDSTYLWSLNIFKAFLRKIESSKKNIKIIFVFPELIHSDYLDYSYKIQSNPNSSFTFFKENNKYFKYFQSNNYLKFFKNYTLTHGNLSKLMQKYLYKDYNDDIIQLEEQTIPKFNFQNSLECDQYFHNYFDSDADSNEQLDFSFFLSYGNLETQKTILDTISFFNINVNDIYGCNILTNNLYVNYFSTLWFQSFKNNL